MRALGQGKLGETQPRSHVEPHPMGWEPGKLLTLGAKLVQRRADVEVLARGNPPVL